jgi:hypothetical protein
MDDLKPAQNSRRGPSKKYTRGVSDEEYARIIQELAEWCATRGRKQQLADELKVSHSLVSLWLKGQRPLSLKQWLKIRKIIRRKRK